MSSVINIYASDAEDFDCEGLGTLCPLEWFFKNGGAEGASLTLKHPYDEDGRWQLIQAGRIIRADVPVRTVPEIENGAMIATAEQWRVLSTATKDQRRLYTKQSGGKKKKMVRENTVVTVVYQGENRTKIRTSRYGSGWIDNAALDVKIKDVPYNTPAAVEAATPSVQARAQLFRLQQPKPGEKWIEAEALPVAYDAMGVLTDPYTGSVLTGPQALKRILDYSYLDTDLELYTNIGDSRTAFEKRNVNIIDAILNGDDSFVGRWGGDVLMDDWTITILRSAGVDRGFYATYGRNLTAIESYEVSDDVITAIVPVGEKANGEPLYLDGSKIVYATNYAQFPLPHMSELKVSEAKVDKKGGVTVAEARQRMREAVAAEWAKGVHIPEISLRIKFALLGDSEEYKRFKDLDQCHLYDVVHVWHPRVCGYVQMAVAEIVWDGMRQRYTEMTLGTPGGRLSDAKISANSISEGISGRQIAWNTINSGNLADECIDARHVQAESINAEAIQAETLTADTAVVRTLSARSIDALTAAISSITAQTIHTDSIAAAFADLFSVVADNIEARTVVAEKLDAIIENVVTTTAKAASFDLATVQNLIGSALTLQQGTADSMYITNLAITSANMLNATVGHLVVKGDDGKYYEIGVGANGVISTAQITPTQQEIDAGEMSDGRGIIVEDSISAQSITGETIMAQEAVINQILTDSLNAGHITAGDALIASASIPTLYTTSIEAIGTTIDISANDSIFLQAGDAGEDGHGLRKVLRLDTDGVHIGDTQSTTEVLIDASTVKVKQRGSASAAYSTFAGNYVQFGNYRLRRTADGGLAFNLAE